MKISAPTGSVLAGNQQIGTLVTDTRGVIEAYVFGPGIWWCIIFT
ncbi:hypothetical protein GDI2425 [Gluconacetobacter diazotrophicus PA1 5]|uniref:Uncharacterized protein n=1 Tax=Gluconacetobacter diazotrophicus (strain ATCC 49037 / DSM 5601 / CCUG 37298 / CIP 103539 / LMG 7603 / PAl5) TaxID=272568 RepID=A9HMY7_GLUDA|nr:hypothetical protein GDI2425 [Gluconacetobacter diazotrophicus PA1 5]